MKKLVSLLLAVLMLSMSALALAEAPEGYPEVVEGIDFGGRTLKIHCWYDMPRAAEPTEEEAALYAYQDWLMETYNVKVEWVVDYDWGSASNALAEFVANPTGELAIYTMPQDFIGPALKNNLLMGWDNLVDLTAEKWDKGTLEFMTVDGQVRGVFSSFTEPREVVFFNKQHLIDANIDPESIYDMQAEGTWTWEAMLDLFAKVQKDVDGDGVIDIWASSGDGSDLTFGALASNGGSFYRYEDDKLVLTMNEPEAIAAFEFVQTIRNNYFRHAQTDAEGNTENWDYFKLGFPAGQFTFRFGQSYEGFNGNAEMNVEGFEWGCVAFPTGPKQEAGNYVTVVSDNLVCIPNVYSEEDAKLIGFLWDQWSNPTPGYEDDDEGWIGRKYNFTDDRAVEETYATLISEGHAVRDYYMFVGDKNTITGPNFIWPIDSMDAASLVESVLPVFQAYADDFNNK